MGELSRDERAELLARLQDCEHPSARVLADEIGPGASVVRTFRGTAGQILELLRLRLQPSVASSGHSSLEPLAERAASASGGRLRVISVFGRRHDGCVVVDDDAVLFTWVFPVGREMTPADRRG